MAPNNVHEIEKKRKAKEAEQTAAREAKGEGKKEPKSHSTTAIEIMTTKYFVTGAKLFQTADGRTFYRSRYEAVETMGESFASKVQECFWKHESTALSAQSTKEVQNHFHGVARWEGSGTHEVFVRVGNRKGKIYLDLCNPKLDRKKQGIVEIDAMGWRLVSQKKCRVLFRRPSGMLPLDAPEQGGLLDELREFINLGADEETPRRWAKLVSWMVGCLDPFGPYMVLLVQGEQGSAKSSLARAARAVFDPNMAELRTASAKISERDLAIACDANWVLAFDNLSTISPELSDTFCRIATGGAFATRKLHSDRDEAIFSFKRPQMLTGIDLKLRSDLAGRTATMNLPPIADSKRKDERSLWSAFEAARPRILAGLLTAAAAALANYETAILERPPRMADAARWAVAAEPAFVAEDGTILKKGDVLKALSEDRDATVASQLEASPLTAPIGKLLNFSPGFVWRGTAEELLEELSQKVTERVRSSRGWPGGGSPLSGALRRLAPNLRHQGIDCSFDIFEGHGKRKVIELRLMPNASAESATEAGEGSQPEGAPSPEIPSQTSVVANRGKGEGVEGAERSVLDGGGS
jgi:putative DNA primase/helicase